MTWLLTVLLIVVVCAILQWRSGNALGPAVRELNRYADELSCAAERKAELRAAGKLREAARNRAMLRGLKERGPQSS